MCDKPTIMLHAWPLLVVLYVSLDLVNFKFLAPGLYTSFYKNGIVDYTAAGIIYALYPLSVMYLTNAATSNDVVRRGFVLGVTVYGLYHLTSMATLLLDWSMPVAVWDTLWGGFVTAVIARAAFSMK
jgi:uncharacterized membrane protein